MCTKYERHSLTITGKSKMRLYIEPIVTIKCHYGPATVTDDVHQVLAQRLKCVRRSVLDRNQYLSRILIPSLLKSIKRTEKVKEVDFVLCQKSEFSFEWWRNPFSVLLGWRLI